MVTHLCRLVPCEKLDDGILTVRFIDLESNLKLTLKLSANNPILQQIDDMGLIVLERDWKHGRGIYSELPEVLVAMRERERKEFKLKLFAFSFMLLSFIAILVTVSYKFNEFVKAI